MDWWLALAAIAALEAHHAASAAHARRVALICALVVRAHPTRFGRFTPDQVEIGGLCHDLGKVRVPVSVLDARRPLTAREVTRYIRPHPQRGVDLLEQLALEAAARTGGDAYPLPPYIRAMTRDHHERWDGSGYPTGKRGAEVARITALCAIADVYEALTAPRPYHRGHPYTPAEARVFLARGGGVLFCPTLTPLVLATLEATGFDVARSVG